MIFDRSEYDLLASIVFRPDYPGWKPDVKELPNGDGKVDEKKYAHIAPKYLPGLGSGRERTLLLRALFIAHERAERVFDELVQDGIGFERFRPDIRYGALRVLEYAPKIGLSHPHRDFDLFTLQGYRSDPSPFKAYDRQHVPATALEIDPGLHLGELGEEIGLGKATLHEVVPSDETQFSIVYFAIPDWDARFVEGERGGSPTVKDWLNERMARSRTAFKAYQ